MQRRALPNQHYDLLPRGFFLKSGTVEIYTGNTLDVLRTLPANKFQCAVTSPPYWALRDYGTSMWEGGDLLCKHIADPHKTKVFGNPEFNLNRPSREATKLKGYYFDTICEHCGAIRTDQQLGLEPTPQEYVANLVAVFREVWRVLRPDGICFLNLGDSYASGGNGPGSGIQLTNVGSNMPARRAPPGIKPKDLVGIPWRVAFALQDDGWYLRNDIIWHKLAVMPESVTDRCTNSHEHVFLLTKSAQYFWDQDAVKEKGVIPAGTLAAKGSNERLGQFGVNARPAEYKEYDGLRNIRDVWTINPESYGGAHFATFPTKLVEICVKAGTSEHGCCTTCGAPWERIIESTGVDRERNIKVNTKKALTGVNVGHRLSGGDYVHARMGTNKWQPTCKCVVNTPVPCTVLDPFGGAGTSGLVAGLLARHATIIDLNPDYVRMAYKRITDAEVPVVLK